MLTLGVTLVAAFRNWNASPKMAPSRRSLPSTWTRWPGSLSRALLVLERQRRRNRLAGVDEGDLGAAQGQHEILVPGAAAELAVGHDLEADALLQRDRVADRRVLDRAQLVEGAAALDRRVLIALETGARVEQFLRTQQAADDFGAERRLAHGRLSLNWLLFQLSGIVAPACLFGHWVDGRLPRSLALLGPSWSAVGRPSTTFLSAPQVGDAKQDVDGRDKHDRDDLV